MSFLRLKEKPKASKASAVALEKKKEEEIATDTTLLLANTDSNRPSEQETGLGALDISSIQQQRLETEARPRKMYYKWDAQDRFNIGKYALQMGNAAAVRRYKSQFKNLNEITVREFKKRAENELKKARKENRPSPKEIPKYSIPTGRPLLLGELDAMVQSYLRACSQRGAVTSSCVAISTAKALIQKYPDTVGDIDIESSTWAQSLFRRMGFVKRMKTSAKVDIPDGARKEIEYLFHNEIVTTIEKYNIPPSLIINLDQTPSKYVPVGNTTLAQKNSCNVIVAGSSDKRTITATFAITLRGDFLPMQLIYGGKTNQSLPRYKFPQSFCLSVNPKHYSNTEESLKFINKVLVPYIKQERASNKLAADHKALVIMDVFTGQMTSEVLALFMEHNICIVNVPPNMTKYYQPLDLTVNGYAKRFTKNKFNEWYAQQITRQLQEGNKLENVDVKLRLSTLKPLHAGWLVALYNEMTSAKVKKSLAVDGVQQGLKTRCDLG
eukprot:gene6691-7447_t